MDLQNAILNRKSIRKFKNVPVDMNIVNSILELASHAPYPKVAPNWSIIVFEGVIKENFNKLLLEFLCSKKEVGGSTKNSLKICIKAPVIVLVFSKYKNKENSLEDNLMNHSYVQATGAFIQNVLLCAQSLELGTLWVNDILYFSDEIRAYLKTNEKLMSAILIGYPENTFCYTMGG